MESYKRQEHAQEIPKSSIGDKEHLVRFDPPLYIQRYDYVINLLKNLKCATYLDIGCSECKLLCLIKNSNTNLNLIVGVDIDHIVLHEATHKFDCIMYDMIYPRDHPLDIYLIKGDLANPSPYFIDQMKYESTNLDFVSLVELIEHLYPDTLEKLIHTVFAQLKPKYVLISTPNSEFNVVFEDGDSHETNNNCFSQPNNQTNKKFRHWDHKFEWTRKEFQTWCQSSILNKHQDYELVCYDGVGKAPISFEHDVGNCSQIAFFARKPETMLMDKSQTKFAEYIKKKKAINIYNRLEKQAHEQCKEIEPYLKYSEFQQPDEVTFNFSCIYSRMYPFETFDFENEFQRNMALFREVNNLIFFMIKSNRFSEELNANNIVEDEFTSRVKKEKIENNIDLDDYSINLINIDSLIEFNDLKKFQLSKEEFVRILDNDSPFELTKSKHFIVHRDDHSSLCSGSSDKENDYNSENQEERRTDSHFEYDEQKINCNHSDEKEPNTSFFEESWDELLPKKPKPFIIYSPEEQFEDADSNSDLDVKYLHLTKLLTKPFYSNLHAENSPIDETIYEINPNIGCNLYKGNYNSNRNDQIHQAYKIRQRKNLKELKKFINQIDESTAKIQFGLDSDVE
jgi:hypothetical protein